METQIPLTLIDFFKFIGTPALVGWLVSMLAQRVPAFQRLGGDAKFAVIMALCIVCAAGSYALVNYVPSAFIEALQPWYAQIVNLVIAVIGSQVYHRLMHGGETIIEVTAVEDKDEAING